MFATPPQLRVLQYITLENINHLRLLIYMLAICVHIMQMNMPVQQIPWFEPLHEGQEGGKALMATVGVITKSQGSCMGDQNIYIPPTKYTVEQKAGNHLEHPEIHFTLGELMRALVVAHRPAQAGDDKILLSIVENLSIDKVAAEAGQHLHFPIGVSILHDRLGVRGELVQKLKIMIAEHKKERLVQAGDDELIVFERQVTGCNDRIDIGIPGGDVLGVDQRVRFIRDTENLHTSPR